MKKQPSESLNYERRNAANLARQNEKSAAARDVAASCPPVKDLANLARIKTDLKFALEVLFPLRFNLAWGPDHLKLIADLERAIRTGEQLARAMPRGTGKTSLLLCSIIVAILTGEHEFACLFGSTAGAAKELLEQITTELESNDELYAYFPELIHPIRCLEGIHQRRLLWNGEPLSMNFRTDRLILPNVPGVPGGSAIIHTAGLLGRLRGLAFQRPDGRNVRPTLVLVDDPQTDASAVSQRENDKRESVICNTIPGLAGPGRKTSVLVAVTVKAVGDCAERILDRERNPAWHGERTALLRSLPTNVDLWNQYAEILKETLRADEPIDRATEFYRANQAAMDEGAEASWPARFNEGEISGIQFAMGIKILNPASFASEYQNRPLVLQDAAKQTDADKVVLRTNGRARGVIPLECEIVTCGVDIQKNYLVYTIGGFSTDATPWIVDYGTFPDQRTAYFDRRSATRTIDREFSEGDDDAKLWAALDGLMATLLDRDYKREDSLQTSLKKICIDVRYKGALVKRYIRQSKFKDILLAAQGIHTTAGSAGINERAAQPGEISKHSFRLPPLGNGQIARTVSFDSADYITKVHESLNTPKGQKGALTLFESQPHLHRCFADQLCSEFSTMVTAKGRTKKIWTAKPNGGDNDFLDSTKLMFLAGYVVGVEPVYTVKAIAKPVSQPVARASRAPRFASI